VTDKNNLYIGPRRALNHIHLDASVGRCAWIRKDIRGGRLFDLRRSADGKLRVDGVTERDRQAMCGELLCELCVDEHMILHELREQN
jgi:hypothetical protein